MHTYANPKNRMGNEIRGLQQAKLKNFKIANSPFSLEKTQLSIAETTPVWAIFHIKDCPQTHSPLQQEHNNSALETLINLP
jgi:hypothetical protein